ncbi:glycosyltransferase [Candidatus Saganbacteria bacterium]|uniref:Glycosyltransferase n=1 Tax=Candidatus Saganbacteria bacterium TaxID=2575572 RepID=A0A9D6UM56_UNCSA|nr:glycosyltransferase [Candidatus Saganbacteria bacterium]
MKLAIVHDFLNQFGGAERVVSAFHELYPKAPVYTSIYDKKNLPEKFRFMDIRPSFMQKLPLIFPLFKFYLPFYPMAFESFDLSGYDVILSSSSAFAKGIRKNKNQLHICYCHTPMRFVWRFEDYMKREALPSWLKGVLWYILEPIKQWDLRNTAGVDFFIANSITVAERIKKIYGRESDIISPPVESDFFRPGAADRDNFLVVSRLNAYKRIDIVVEAFNRLDLSLKIIGDGPQRKKLEREAGANIKFLGRLSDREVAEELAACRALVFPGEEDFGIVPLEAMACGRPVIAYRAGGARETVIEGENGVFFDSQTSAALVQAVKRFQFAPFDKSRIRKYAVRYDKEAFKRKIEEFVNDKSR